jgi:hypothetical protein
MRGFARPRYLESEVAARGSKARQRDKKITWRALTNRQKSVIDVAKRSGVRAKLQKNRENGGRLRGVPLYGEAGDQMHSDG